MIGGFKQTTSRFAIAAAAGLFMGGIALTPVQAADLGGDCCADLEERVAELEATTVRKGNRKVSVKLSGNVTRAIMWWDDGHDSNSFYVDGGVTRSRFTISGSATISPGRTAGFKLEEDLNISNHANSVSNCDGNNVGVHCMEVSNPSDANSSRFREIWIKDERLGMVSLGKGNMASNGSSEVDLSGTTVLSYAGMSDWGGGFFFRTNAGAYSARKVSHYTDLDGDSRQDRIRYDTPSLGGFTLSTSHRRDVIDFAIRFKKEWNSVRCAAASAWLHNTGDKNYDYENWSSSASCLHTPSGLNLTVAYAAKDYGTAAPASALDTDFFFVKGGITRRWNSHGKTSISVEYGENSDTAVLGDDINVWGVDFVQNIDAAALELYAGYRVFEYDDNTTASYEEVDFFIAGARIKF